MQTSETKALEQCALKEGSAKGGPDLTATRLSSEPRRDEVMSPAELAVTAEFERYIRALELAEGVY